MWGNMTEVHRNCIEILDHEIQEYKVELERLQKMWPDTPWDRRLEAVLGLRRMANHKRLGVQNNNEPTLQGREMDF